MQTYVEQKCEPYKRESQRKSLKGDDLGLGEAVVDAGFVKDPSMRRFSHGQQVAYT